MDVQADLSLRWAQRSLCWFCHATAHMNTVLQQDMDDTPWWTEQILQVLGTFLQAKGCFRQEAESEIEAPPELTLLFYLLLFTEEF